MATLIGSDGSETNVAVPTLVQAQAMVGGYVQVTWTTDLKRFMLVNDEGLVRGMPVNEKATRLHGMSQPIVGNVVLIDKKEPGARKWC